MTGNKPMQIITIFFNVEINILIRYGDILRAHAELQ